jgi:hypothetical protein
MDSNANLLASLTQSSTRRAASAFRRATEGFQPGQELVSTDVTLGGQYNVAVQRTPKTNAALKFASSLQQGVQVYGQAVNVVQKDAAEKVAEMSDEEFEKAYGELLAQQGETDPSVFGTILGRDKQFQQSMVDRWFRDVAPTEVKGLQDTLKGEIQNFKTTSEFDAYVNKAVDDYFAEKSTQFSDGTHAQTAYNVRAAGASAKMKIELDKAYSDEAETSIYNNQKDIAKQTITDRVLITGTTPEGNSEVMTSLYKNALVALGGDKAEANKVLVEAVSDEITNLVTEGTTTSLEKAEEIFDTFFNEDLVVDGRKDIFDKPELEFQLKRAIESGEVKAIEDESRKADALVKSVTAELYASRAKGDYAQTVEELRQRLNDQRDNGQISDAEYSAANYAIDQFNEDPELEANRARKNAQVNAVNEMIRENRNLSSNPTLFWNNLEISNEEAFDLGYYQRSADNEAEFTGKVTDLQNIYRKAYETAAANAIEGVDLTTLSISEQTERTQSIDTLAREAGDKAVQAELESIRAQTGKTAAASTLNQAVLEAEQRNASQTEIELIKHNHKLEPEIALEKIQALPPIDESKYFDAEGNLEELSPLERLYVGPKQIVARLGKEFRKGRINSVQFDKATRSAYEARRAYVPAPTDSFSKVMEDTLEMLSVSGISSAELESGVLDQLYTFPSYVSDPVIRNDAEKRSAYSRDFQRLADDYFRATGEFIVFGITIPVYIDGSPEKTLDAIRNNDVGAFASMAEKLGMTPKELLENSRRYHQLTTKLIPSNENPQK